MLSSRPVSIHHDGPLGGVSLKTPGRGLVRNRSLLQENAVTLKGKKTFKTPSKQGATLHVSRTPGAAKGKPAGAGKAPTLAIARPLGEKTPFPNRNRDGLETPFPMAKIALDPVPGLTPAPAALLRPSSARQSVRRSSRASGSLGLGGIGGLNLEALGIANFQTPRVNGNPWDVEDIEINVPTNEVAEAAEADVETEDFDEIEYMPPTAIDPPYEPAFDMPDYKSLGRALLNYPHSLHADNAIPPPDFTVKGEDKVIASLTVIPPPLTVDDPTPLLFASSPPPAESPPTQASNSSTSRPTSRTATSAQSMRPIGRLIKPSPPIATGRAAISARLGALKTAPAGPSTKAREVRPAASSSRLAPSAPSRSTAASDAPARPRSVAATTRPSSRPGAPVITGRGGVTTTGADKHPPRPVTVASMRPPVRSANTTILSKAGPSHLSRNPSVKTAKQERVDGLLAFEDTAEQDDFMFAL